MSKEIVESVIEFCAALEYCGRNNVGHIKVQSGTHRFLLKGNVQPLDEWHGGDVTQKDLESDPADSHLTLLLQGRRTRQWYVAEGALARVVQGRSIHKRQKAPPLTQEQYQTELQRIKLCLEAGGNPTVGMRFIACHAGCSASTVNRHIVAGLLPKPRKLGGKSVWLFVDAEAYAHGKEVGKATARQTRVAADLKTETRN